MMREEINNKIMKKEIENKFYVYLHIKLDTGEPFYVGRGHGPRYKETRSRSTFWKNIVKNHNYDIIFLETNLSNEDANKKEIYWINRIGRRELGLGTLVNHTSGGEGFVGQVLSEEHKNKIRKAHLGRKCSEETRKKMSDSRNGKTNSEEMKKNLADSKNKSYNKTLVINLENGIYYSIQEAADSIGIKYGALSNKVNGINKNNTKFIIV